MSDRFFDFVLRLYPKTFRDEYGAEMRRVYQDQLRHEHGWRGWIRVHAGLLLDAAIAAPREHRRAGGAPGDGYRLSKAGLDQLFRQGHAPGHGLYAILCVAVSFAISWAGEAPHYASAGVFGLLAAHALMTFWGTHRHKNYWRAYSLCLEADSLTESRGGRPLKHLRASEIERIIAVPGSGISVIAREESSSLWIPEPIGGFETIREQLSSWAPFETRAQPRPPAGALMMHGFFPLYAAALLVRVQILGLILSIAAAGLLVSFAFRVSGPNRLAWRLRLFYLLLFAILAVRSMSSIAGR